MNNTFKFINIDLIPTVGISTALTVSQDENLVVISNLWQRFNAEIHKIRNRPSSGQDWQKFGITYAQNNEYYYLAAIQYVDKMIPPLNMIRKDISQGRYARFTHVGKMSHLKKTIYAIYKEKLPEKNLTPQLLNKASLIHFERYNNRFHWNRSDSIIEIYVPIKMAAS